MIIQANFVYKGKSFQYSRSQKKLDRNYDDESYAYFVEPIADTEDGFFEINILKSEEVKGVLQEEGYTAVYSSTDHVMPDIIVDTIIRLV